MSNAYQKKHKKDSLLGAITHTQETHGDIKGSAIETTKDLVVGVIGGGVAGSAIGRASLLVGAGLTLAGHYTKTKLLQVFGIGMMAANGFQNRLMPGGVNGVEKEGLEGVKERVNAFKESFSEKLFLDKFLKKRPESTNGIGEVQYFTYPQKEQQRLEGSNDEMGAAELDLSALEKLENQVLKAGADYQKKQGMSGAYDNMSGVNDDINGVNDDTDFAQFDNKSSIY